MFNKILIWLHMCCAYLLLANINCTTPPLELLPNEGVMHFPFSMAMKKDMLLVSSGASDGKYGSGRLVAVSTNAVSQALQSKGPKDPIPWNEVVKANVLIPPDVGLISIGDQIIFASRANNKLYALPEKDNAFSCNNPNLKIDDCPEASEVQLPQNDPYALAFIGQNPAADMILVSYLSSDRIDLVELDKSTKSHSLRLVNQFSAQKWVEENLKGTFGKNTRVITKNIMVTHASDPKQATVYFLLEKRLSRDFLDKKIEHKSAFKIKTLKENIGALILSIKVSDLPRSGQPSVDKITLLNLQNSFGITLVQDFYVDDNDVAVILGRAPEALFKINLLQNTLIETQTICRGASSIAVSPSEDLLFVPCFTDNRVISFNLSSLGQNAASGLHGRGPVFVAIDEINRKIFVSYNNDGKVGIFDFGLKYMGHIFKSATNDRVGS